MRSRNLISVALVAILSLVAASCGDDGGGSAAVSSEARPYVEAITTAMHNDNDDDVQLSDAQIDCIAPRWVGVIGVERFESNGVTPEDLASDSSMEFADLNLTEDDGGKLYDAFGDCDVNLREQMMEEMAADDDMSATAKACMEGVFTDENLRKIMVATLVKGDDALQEDPELSPIMAQLMGCAFMSMGDEFEDGLDGLDDLSDSDLELPSGN